MSVPKTQRATKPLAERFNAKTLHGCAHECWPWLGSKDRNGYGQIGRGGKRGKTEFAHRISYELHYGENPGESRVLHSCDNPSCVNPNHLRLGTQKDNVADMEERSRAKHPDGERNGRAKWTDEEMAMAVAAAQQGDTVAAVARRLGADVEYFRKVVKGYKRPRVLRVGRASK